MPRLAPEKRGAGFAVAVVDRSSEFYGAHNLSASRCPTCSNRLPVALVEAGETSHPACIGFPRWWYAEEEKRRRAEHARGLRQLEAKHGKIGK